MGAGCAGRNGRGAASEGGRHVGDVGLRPNVPRFPAFASGSHAGHATCPARGAQGDARRSAWPLFCTSSDDWGDKPDVRERFRAGQQTPRPQARGVSLSAGAGRAQAVAPARPPARVMRRAGQPPRLARLPTDRPRARGHRGAPMDRRLLLALTAIGLAAPVVVALIILVGSVRWFRRRNHARALVSTWLPRRKRG